MADNTKSNISYRRYIITAIAIFIIVVYLMLINSYFQTNKNQSTSTISQTQPQLDKLIEKMISNGYVTKVSKDNSYPRVYVTSKFTHLDYNQKKTYISIVLNYYQQLNPKVDTIFITKSNNNQEIGVFTKQFGLKMV